MKNFFAALILISVAPALATINNTNTSFDKNKIIHHLSILLQNKNKILKGSIFGENEILFFNPSNKENFVAETNGKNSFTLRPMTTEELKHSIKVLDDDSLYSQLSFGKTRLVMTICKDCLLKKLKQLPRQSQFENLSNEEWLAALSFHESTHAFDQKNWNSIYEKYPRECRVKIQEGSAFLAEARSFSLLKFGNFQAVSDYIQLFQSVGDPLLTETYILPAIKFNDFETRTGRSYIDGLEKMEFNPCEKYAELKMSY